MLYKLLVQVALVACILYQSWLGMHDKMYRRYFEYRFRETVLFLIDIKHPAFLKFLAT